MQRQDKNWYLGLTVMFVGICLLLSSAFAAFLFFNTGQDNLTEWMMNTSKDIHSEISPLPEASSYEPVYFVPGELSPFDREVPANSTKKRN